MIRTTVVIYRNQPVLIATDLNRILYLTEGDNISTSNGPATPDGSLSGFAMESDVAASSGQLPLGNSVTYTSISGLPHSETTIAVTTPQSPPGALSQLVLNSNIFVEPSLAGLGVSASNGTSTSFATATLARDNATNQSRMNTLTAKRPNASQTTPSKYAIAPTDLYLLIICI
jgi:hypothetical protein